MLTTARRSILALLVIVLAAACATAQPSGPAPPGAATPAAGTEPAPPTSAGPSASAPTTEPPLASATPAPVASASPSAPIPAFRHIYLIVMENHEADAIVGNDQAPYINRLIARYGLATRYMAVAHPSLPNYLALFAGSTFGIGDDGTYDLPGATLAGQVSAAGRTWHVYAQDLPGTCSRVASAAGPVDLVGAAGTYARKHEPAISFTDISGDPAACARITNLAGFSPRAADLEIVIPNLTNDMHDGTIAQGDDFLASLVPRITTSPDFPDSVLLITWDEGASGAGGGGRVATIVVSPRVPAGFRSSVEHDHYSLLRTIEEAWGLGCLREACRANDLREFFAP